MLNALLMNPQKLFGLILTPTRELALQIAEQVEALGKLFDSISINIHNSNPC